MPFRSKTSVSAAREKRDFPSDYEVKRGSVKSPVECIKIADSEQKKGGH